MIDLYFWPTPNTRKVLIFLEESGLAYRIVPVNILKDDQFTPDFLAIGPNNKVPVIVDPTPCDGGGPLSVFESGAILVYLAEKTGKFFPSDLRTRTAVAEWIMFQMANQGPKSGENNHFRRAAQNPANGDLTYPLKRFGAEVRRIYGVLDARLAQRPYLAGQAYTIADMLNFPWAERWEMHGLDPAEFPNVARWTTAIAERPAVVRAMAVDVER